MDNSKKSMWKARDEYHIIPVRYENTDKKKGLCTPSSNYSMSHVMEKFPEWFITFKYRIGMKGLFTIRYIHIDWGKD